MNIHMVKELEIRDMYIAELRKEVGELRAKLTKIQEHLLSAKEYIDATECIQPCDSYGVCFKCSIEGDILIALMEYRGEETK